MSARILVAVLTFASLAAVPRRVHACSTCSALDPTIAAPLYGTPAEQSVQIAVDASVRGEEQGALAVDERRFGLRLRYAPRRGLAMQLNAALAHQTVVHRNGARLERFGAADPSLSLQWVAFQDAYAAPRHTLSLVGEVSVPLGSHRNDERLPGLSDVDVGSSRVSAQLGSVYRFTRGAWSTLVRAQGFAGDDLGGELALQQLYTASSMLSLELGFVTQASVELDDLGDLTFAGFVQGGFWLNAPSALIGVRVAAPLAGPFGALFAMEVWFDVH